MSILPLDPNRIFDEENLGRMTAYFPLVGLAFGVVLIVVDKLAGLFLPLGVINILLVIVLLLVSGGLHLDGLMDTADGLGSGRSRERKLEIMRDSRVGSWGVIAAVSIILLKLSLIQSVPLRLRFFAWLLTPTLGRWAIVYSIMSYPYARKEPGLGKVFAENTGYRELAIASAIALIPSLLLLGFRGLLLFIGIATITLIISRAIAQKLGGMTGDTYGAMNELMEVITLMLFVIITS